MKIVIPGGSGQVGTIIARKYHAEGHEVVVLARRPAKAEGWSVMPWDGKTFGPWCRDIDGADVVINLAGRTVNCRYNDTNRREMMESRIDSTRVVGEAISQAGRPPALWLQASTATIYAHRFDASNDEATGIIDGALTKYPAEWDFSKEIAQAWEATLAAANTPRTRKVAMRSAMTMSPDRGGIFDTLATLASRGLGGNAGNGKQFVSWVHEQDFLKAIQWLMDHDEFVGPVNIASPNPLPYRDFMKALREAEGVKIGLPATKLMLEIGAVFMRTETELVLKSRRVVPGKLLDSGFQFEYPHWPEAARELVNRWKAGA